LGAGSFSMATYGEAPRISLALWAKALVPSTVPAATAAAIPIAMVVKSWRLSWLTTTEPGRVRIVTLPGFVGGIVGGIEIFKAARSPSLA
jgi:hypothetical protein